MGEQIGVIRWEDPPPAKRRAGSSGRSRYAAAADELRADPGRWGVIAEIDAAQTAMATAVRRGHLLCFTPAGDFDAVARQSGGRTTIYARYLGDNEQDYA
jgi:hypothetical protein